MATSALKTKAKHITSALFGVDPDGHGIFFNLSDGPHWIVCGQTGSGKSVAMNSIIISILYHTTPDEVVVSWVDPKFVEASAYKGLPYCPFDPVTNMDDAYGLMLFYTYLMDKRYAMMSSVDKKDIGTFNTWVEENPEKAKELGYNKLPYVICIIDEYADMVMQNPKVEDPIIRLGQKARACGIILMIATQRPSADIITPTLKANIPSRIAGRVTDGYNSRIILDEDGAEKLRGKGDLLIKPPSGEFVRVQSPFITDGEIAEIFAYLRKNAKKTIDFEVDFTKYKSILVENDYCVWAEEYEDSVPEEDRHVKAQRRRGGMF